MEGNCQFGEMLLMWGKLFGEKYAGKRNALEKFDLNFCVATERINNIFCKYVAFAHLEETFLYCSNKNHFSFLDYFFCCIKVQLTVGSSEQVELSQQ